MLDAILNFIYSVFTVESVKMLLFYFEIFFVIYLIVEAVMDVVTFIFAKKS